MSESQQDRLQKLNTILDQMVSSENFRHDATQSGLGLLVAAKRLIEAPHPHLSDARKIAIHQQVLATADLSTSEFETNQVQGIALFTASTPTLSDTARQNIFTQMMASVPTLSHAENTLSDTTRQRLSEPMMVAQQQLQIDALVESDEALFIAQGNDDPVVQAAVRLRSAVHPYLSTDRKTQLLEQVLTKETHRQPIIMRPNFGQSLQRIAASIAILLFVSLIAIPPASADSLPGDILYPVKRSLERVSLQFAGSESDQARIHLAQANERLDEFKALARTNNQAVQGRLLNDAMTSLEAVMTLTDTSRDLADHIVLQNDLSASVMALSNLLQTVTLDDTARLQDLVQRQSTLRAFVALPDNQTSETIIIETDTPEISIPQQTSIIETETPDPSTASVESPSEVIEAVDGDDIITLYVFANSLVRVRDAASLNSQIIAQVAPHEPVTQLSISDDGQWIFVELANGQIGWIAEFLLSSVQATPMPIVNISDTPNNASSNGNSNGNRNGNKNANRKGKKNRNTKKQHK